MPKVNVICTRSRDWAVYLSAAVLAVLYLAGWTAVQLHSSGDHHMAGESCSQTMQSDACHDKIYHGLSSDECLHTAHVFETVVECRICDLMVSKNQITAHHEISRYSPCMYSDLFPTAGIDPVALYDAPLSLRGPPLKA